MYIGPYFSGFICTYEFSSMAALRRRRAEMEEMTFFLLKKKRDL